MATTSPRAKELGLTARDFAVIHHVTQHRAVALDQLAPLFFAKDPLTGKRNTNPARACERRVMLLASYGYLAVRSIHDGAAHRRVASPGSLATEVTGVSPARRRVPPQKGAHHLRTLDAVARVERLAQLARRKVIEVKLDQDLRAEEQGGRFLRTGDQLPVLPDAVVTVAASATGGKPTRIAIEYVTSKYTNADILTKHDGFERFDKVMWFADRQRTADRVKRLTGKSCEVLS